MRLARRLVAVEESRGVDGDAFAEQRFGFAARDVEVGRCHAHIVARQGAGLVGADDGGGAHSLAGVHLAHEVVGSEHASHTQRKAQCDAHRQAFWHRHHDECYGKHHGRQSVLYGIDGRAVAPVVDEAATDDDECSYDVTCIGYEASETFELQGQRSLHAIVDGGCLVDVTLFGGVAYGCDNHHAAPLHNGGAAHHHIGRVGGVAVVDVAADVRLVSERFAGERTFVDSQAERFDKAAVGRHFIARVEDYNVVDHDVAPRHFGDAALAQHLHKYIVGGAVENLEFAVGAHFEPEADERGQQYGNQNAGRFKKYRQRCCRARILVHCYADRQRQGHQQNLDERRFEIFDKFGPYRRARRGCDYIYAVTASALGCLLGREACAMV